MTGKYVVDPYDWFGRWQKALVWLRLRRRPEPYTVRNYSLRGVVRAEHAVG